MSLQQSFRYLNAQLEYIEYNIDIKEDQQSWIPQHDIYYIVKAVHLSKILQI